MNLDWIKDIDNVEKVIKEIISDDESLLILFMILLKKQGVEAFIALYESFNKNEITFRHKFINELKKRYVQQHYYVPARKLASKLDLAERTIQDWLKKLSNDQNIGAKNNLQVKTT